MKFSYNLSPRCIWCHMVTWNWVNFGWGNDLFSGGTKPFGEPMLTSQWWSFVLSLGSNFSASGQADILWNVLVNHYTFEIIATYLRGQWVNFHSRKQIPSRGREPLAGLIQEVSYIPYEINIDTPKSIEYILQLRPIAVPNMNRIYEQDPWLWALQQ